MVGTNEAMLIGEGLKLATIILMAALETRGLKTQEERLAYIQQVDADYLAQRAKHPEILASLEELAGKES